jgi:hypothetical protein
MTLRMTAFPKKTFTVLRAECSGSDSCELSCRRIKDRTLRALVMINTLPLKLITLVPE